MVVGLVGCGRWGRHILRDLGTLGCEVLSALELDVPVLLRDALIDDPEATASRSTTTSFPTGSEPRIRA